MPASVSSLPINDSSVSSFLTITSDCSRISSNSPPKLSIWVFKAVPSSHSLLPIVSLVPIFHLYLNFFIIPPYLKSIPSINKISKFFGDQMGTKLDTSLLTKEF